MGLVHHLPKFEIDKKKESFLSSPHSARQVVALKIVLNSGCL